MKRILLSKHALERFLERDIDENKIKKYLQKGIIIPNYEMGRMLCIYKDKKSYITLVIEEGKNQIVIITGFPSSAWEIQKYKKVKKYGRKKN